MRLLVRRYITAEQRKRDDFGITEDDVMEIRQDISTLRFELIDILSLNGMKTPSVNQKDVQCKVIFDWNSPDGGLSKMICEFNFWLFACVMVVAVAGKKGKMMERRILKDFQIGIVETIVSEAVKNSAETRDVFSSIAKAINKRSTNKQYVIYTIKWLRHFQMISTVLRCLLFSTSFQ